MNSSVGSAPWLDSRNQIGSAGGNTGNRRCDFPGRYCALSALVDWRSRLGVRGGPLKSQVFVIGIFAVLLQTVSGFAATLNSPAEIMTAPLELEVTPDVWAFSTKTQAVINGERITSHLPFNEAARNLKSLFLGEISFTKGPLVVLADGNFAKVSLSGSDVPSVVNRVDTNSVWSTVGVGYAMRGEAIVSSSRVRWLLQPTAVAAYTSQDVSIAFDGSVPPRSLDASWWTPAFGLRASATVGAWGIRFVGYSDVADHSRSAKQAALGVEYSPRSAGLGHPTLGIGYRYRYDEREYSSHSQLSTTIRGPMAYAIFHFNFTRRE